MTWIVMYVDWDRDGEITVDAEDEHSVGGREYRGLVDVYRVGSCQVIDDIDQLSDYLREQYGEQIKALLADYSTGERNGEEYGHWGPERPCEADYERAPKGAYYRALDDFEREVDRVQAAREDFEREIEDDCDYYRSGPLPGCLIEVEAGDYLSEAQVDIDRATTDEQIARLANELRNEARAEGYRMTGIRRYLTELRDAAHEAWVEAHTCPVCGERAPEVYDAEAAPSWECSVCAADDNDE